MQRDLEEQRKFFESRRPVAARAEYAPTTTTDSNTNKQSTNKDQTAPATLIQPPTEAEAVAFKNIRPNASAQTASRENKKPMDPTPNKAKSETASAPTTQPILGGIVERNPVQQRTRKKTTAPKLSLGCRNGFPSPSNFDAARRRARIRGAASSTLNTSPSTATARMRNRNTKKKSVFRQRLEAANSKTATVTQTTTKSTAKVPDSIPVPSPSSIGTANGQRIAVPAGAKVVSTGTKSDRTASSSAPPGPMFPHRDDGQQIHNEAMKLLNAMTEEEKLAAQQELLATLPPDLIAMLQARPPSSENGMNSTQHLEDALFANDTAQVRTSTDKSSDEIENLEDVRSEEDLGKLFNRHAQKANPVERARIEWLQPPPAEKSTPASKQRRSAAESVFTEDVRFDLEGRIISQGGDRDAAVEAQTRKDSALHHHGGNETAAGYTFMDLESNILSTYPPQRTLGLATFGSILRRWEGQADGLRLSLRINIPETIVAALVHSLRYSAGGTNKVTYCCIFSFFLPYSRLE